MKSTTQTWMDPETARDLLLKLMRRWRIVYRVAPHRASRRRTQLLEGALADISQFVEAHYDFRCAEPCKTTVSKDAYVLDGLQEMSTLMRIAEQMVASIDDTFVTLPSQQDFRRAFVNSALVAQQLANAPHRYTRFGVDMPAQTSSVALDA
jgi:hypothetical protein